MLRTALRTIGQAALSAVLLLVLLVGASAWAQSVSTGGTFNPLQNYVVSGTWQWNRANPFIIEGATQDAYETILAFLEPTADGTITVPRGTDQLVGRATTDTLTNKTLTSPTITSPIFSGEAVTAAGATETLTSADCGQTTLLDTITGSVVTLPAATGSGCVFRFLVTLTNTSNDHSVVVVGNDEFIGGLLSVGTTADQTDAFTAAPAGGVDAIQMNGSTEGGLLGTWIVVQDVAADKWGLSGYVISTDASATMLATGVAS